MLARDRLRQEHEEQLNKFDQLSDQLIKEELQMAGKFKFKVNWTLILQKRVKTLEN